MNIPADIKQCKKCNLEKSITEFCTRKGEIDGKHRYCKSCLNQNFKTYYHTSGRKKSVYYKTYREQNKEYFNQYCYNHYHTKKELYREWERNRLKTNPSFRIKKSIMALLNFHLKKNNEYKNKHTIEYLGCSIDEYRKYIELKFTPEMSWENYGDYWEIDHIKPISSFNLNNPEELAKCFYYENTQPLYWKDNLYKSNKY
jgi:hypothetical protein